MPPFLFKDTMSILLLRDTELYISTIDIESESPTESNTTKLSVLPGFSMAQESVSDTYSTFRNSDTPNRVDVRYIKDFDFVDIRLSTYVKIKQVSGTAEPSDKILWNAFTNNGGTGAPSNYSVDFLSSNTNVFPDLYIYINTGGITYKIGKCYISKAKFSFDIDDIAKTDWEIKGLSYSEISATPSTYLDRTESSGYIKGKYSKVELNRSGIDYKLPILGGSIELSQTVIRLSTPIVSQAIAQNPRARIEERSVTGNISTYLRIGNDRSGGLITSMLDSINTINDTSVISMYLGSSNDKYVKFDIPQAIISVPKIDTNEIFSSDISIYPLESANGANDDITITYYN